MPSDATLSEISLTQVMAGHAMFPSTLQRADSEEACRPGGGIHTSFSKLRGYEQG